MRLPDSSVGGSLVVWPGKEEGDGVSVPSTLPGGWKEGREGKGRNSLGKYTQTTLSLIHCW